MIWARRPGLVNWPAAFASFLLLSATGEIDSATARLAPPEVALSLYHTLAPAGWVTDTADILTGKEQALLDRYLQRFQQRTRHQMAVVTVSSLEGRTVDDYAHGLFNRWGVGRKDANDGILVLVAPNERKVRIQIGYGLEKVLADAYCKHVIDAMMLPKFRNGRYYDGIILGVTGLARVARRV